MLLHRRKKNDRISDMFGSNYSQYPEIIIDSFSKMKDDYEEKAKNKENKKLLTFFIKLYIAIFGIPEIGFQIRYLHFKKIIGEYIKKTPRAILDAGSGIGSYSFFLHGQYPRADITGGDIDKEKLSFSRKYVKSKKIKNVNFSYMDVSKKKLQKNKYDLIVSIDVLEHIKNYRQVLYNFSRFLRPGGFLYIHTPHKNQKRIFSFSENWHHEDHVREGFSKSQLIKEIEKLNLKIIVGYQTFGPFGRFSWEINHILLEKSFILAGLLYPLLYAVALLDIFVVDSNGWGIALLVYKPLKK